MKSGDGQYFLFVAGFALAIVGLLIFNEIGRKKTANDASIAASTLRIAEALERIGDQSSDISMLEVKPNGFMQFKVKYSIKTTEDQLKRIARIPGCSSIAVVRDGVVYPERCR